MSAMKNINLEKSLADLEDLVEELESGDLPLEKAMKKFEDGIKLTRSCQKALKDSRLGRPCSSSLGEKNGAGDGNRTRDQRLGRPRLYH